jgi:hypothetical protein
MKPTLAPSPPSPPAVSPFLVSAAPLSTPLLGLDAAPTPPTMPTETAGSTETNCFHQAELTESEPQPWRAVAQILALGAQRAAASQRATTAPSTLNLSPLPDKSIPTRSRPKARSAQNAQKAPQENTQPERPPIKK